MIAVGRSSALAVGRSTTGARPTAPRDLLEGPVLLGHIVTEGATGSVQRVRDHRAVALGALCDREWLVMQEHADGVLAVVGIVAGEQDEVVPDLVDVLGRCHGTVVGRAEIHEFLHLAEKLVGLLRSPAVLDLHALTERRVVVGHHLIQERRIVGEFRTDRKDRKVTLRLHWFTS
jgi:hypothetical protein